MKHYEVWCASCKIEEGMILDSKHKTQQEAVNRAKRIKAENKGSVKIYEIIENEIKF